MESLDGASVNRRGSAMKCRQCGAENEEQYKFCGVCGIPLTIPAVVKADATNSPPRSKCPYCGTELAAPPKRRKDCPHCGGSIRVRKGVLLTEEEADIQGWLERLGFLSLSRGAFDMERQAFKKELGRTGSIDEVIWRMLDRGTKGSDLNVASCCYQEMSRIAGSKGRDFRPYLVEALRARLLELKHQGVRTVKVVGCNDTAGCRKCRSLAGKKYRIDYALAKMPIPNRCTDEGGCRCGYTRGGDTADFLDWALK